MYIKVSFKSAKVPFTTASLKDGVWKINGNLDKVTRQVTGDCETRSKNMVITNTNEIGNPFGSAENLVHKEQLSNVLHVLLGERPVSFFNQINPDGKPIRQRIKEIDEVTKKCLVRCESNFNFTNKNGGISYVTETVSCKKSLPSNNKEIFSVSWDRLKLRFINEPGKYEKCIEVLNSFLGKEDVTNEYGSLGECLKSMGKDKVYELKNFLKENGPIDLTTLDFLRPQGKNKYGTISVNSYPQDFISIDGTIIYEVTDEMYRRIITGTKCATYLDGGIATLERWDEYGVHEYGMYNIDKSELIDEGYRYITDIDGEEYRTPENYFTNSQKD